MNTKCKISDSSTNLVSFARCTRSIQRDRQANSLTWTSQNQRRNWFKNKEHRLTISDLVFLF